MNINHHHFTVMLLSKVLQGHSLVSELLSLWLAVKCCATINCLLLRYDLHLVYHSLLKPLGYCTQHVTQSALSTYSTCTPTHAVLPCTLQLTVGGFSNYSLCTGRKGKKGRGLGKDGRMKGRRQVGRKASQGGGIHICTVRKHTPSRTQRYTRHRGRKEKGRETKDNYVSRRVVVPGPLPRHDPPPLRVGDEAGGPLAAHRVSLSP